MSEAADKARGAAVRIIQELRRAGHVAYLAGGCVRDALLGIQPKDYDVATGARPEVVRHLFRRSQYVGEAFGVVLVSIKGQAVEVATFRTEWGYEDGRRPSKIEFTDAEHDARRRDFTANGLFADPLDEQLNPGPAGKDRIIDYVDGVADIHNKRLRAIGNPFERFREDYLRMLRAARFAARLGFSIDPTTRDAIRESSQCLSKISRERIGQEVMQMLTGRHPVKAAELIESLTLDAPTFNETHRQAQHKALASLCAVSPGHAPKAAGYAVLLAAWMLDRHEASDSLDKAAEFVQAESGGTLSRWRKALCLSNQDRDQLGQTLSLLPKACNWTNLTIAKRKRLLASTNWEQALALIRAIGRGDAVDRIESESAPLLDQGVAPPRFVGGEDLIQMGMQPSQAMGVLLEHIYDEQLEGRFDNREQALDWARLQLRGDK